MNDYWDFTYDSNNYVDLPEMVDWLHDKDLHYVPIVDAGIAVRSNYLVY